MKVHQFKYRKSQKVIVNKGVEQKRLQILTGIYGLYSDANFRATYKQIDAARKSIKKVLKKAGFIIVKIDMNQFVTSKPSETRMGKGKGTFSHAIGLVNKGTILFEIGGKNLSESLIRKALLQGQERLPFKTVVCNFKK